MKKNNILQNKYLKGGLLLASGLLLGWLFFHHPTAKQTEGAQVEQAHDEHKHTIWTCSMHPQIRMDEPGQCPICGMDLIPLQNEATVVDENAIAMSESAMKLAEVQTTVVSKGGLSKELQLYGKIVPNERLLQLQAAHVPGRIDELLVNTTGEQVRRGQLLAKIYSPELITAQKELLEAAALKDKYPMLLVAAREKLRNWKLSDQQIDQLQQSGQAQTEFPIYANTSGIVTALKVAAGDYVSRGTILFEVADLSSVWAEFDAYESDLPWISKNQTVSFTAQALPGENFSGKVSFIDPIVNAATRVARVRVEVPNPGLKLKPELFVNGILSSSTQNQSSELIIPQSAVLWTGPRSVVYVKVPGTEQPTLKMREITLGPAMKNAWVVKDGLQEGEEIVTNGAFSVDAAAQLAGKPSMMNQEGGTHSTGHNHGGMDMGGTSMASTNAAAPTEVDKSTISSEFKQQLQAVYDAYLEMKNAFVESNASQVASDASAVKKALQNVKMELLKGDAHMAWMDQLKIINSTIENISKSTDIDMQRAEFAAFNEAFYQSIKQFGLHGETAYYQYCPMANSDKGAYWLSETKEIRNPYFGEDMLGCGETRETLK